MIKIILIDDHQLVRSGLREILEAMKNVAVVGEASTGQEGLALLRRLQPDMVVLDLKLPDQTGLEVAQKIIRFNPDIKILVLSAVSDPFSVYRLLEAGAQGYLTKEASAEELAQAIRLMAAGQRVLGPQLAKRLALTSTDYTQNDVFAQISEREMAVLKRIIRGMPVKEIAEELNINSKTVHSYRDRIFQKLNVKTDLAVALLAIHHQMITL